MHRTSESSSTAPTTTTRTAISPWSTTSARTCRQSTKRGRCLRAVSVRSNAKAQQRVRRVGPPGYGTAIQMSTGSSIATSPNGSSALAEVIAPGEQRFQFRGMDPVAVETKNTITNFLVGRQRTNSPSGSCGTNKPLVIETPMKLEQIGLGSSAESDRQQVLPRLRCIPGGDVRQRLHLSVGSHELSGVRVVGHRGN